jgi:hypothetical protein
MNCLIWKESTLLSVNDIGNPSEIGTDIVSIDLTSLPTLALPLNTDDSIAWRKGGDTGSRRPIASWLF